ncbi:hypothetical protein [Flavobacterium sp.]|uniref:hypothetical protein n=1 Tax=Flavobacterium sp. TaxID=239 RepID=UPI00260A610A|nr:hypothetical protein [Flavobacterium sp.]
MKTIVQKIKIGVVVLSTTLWCLSCSNEMENYKEYPQDQLKSASGRLSEEESVTETVNQEELDRLLEGMKLEFVYTTPIIAEHRLNVPESKSKSRVVLREKMTPDHIKQLGYDTEEQVLEVFKLKRYNREKPNGVAINDYQTCAILETPIAVDGGPCKIFEPCKDLGGKFCVYITLGMPKITPVGDENSEYRTTRTIIDNDSDEEDLFKKTYTITQGTSTKWDVERSIGLKLGLKVGMSLGETSIEVSVGMATKKGGTKDEKREIKEEYTTKIPARKKKQILIVEEIKTQYLNYQIPVKLEGSAGLLMHRRPFRRGASASILLKGKKLMEKGNIKVEKAIDFYIYSKILD